MRIFITKDPEDLIPELQVLQQSGALFAKSLLTFEALPFACQTTAEVIFFGSIRAADFFFAQCKHDGLIACAGLETAKKIAEKHHKEVHFIAQQSGNPEQEAKRFATWRTGKKTLFPLAEASLRTYSKAIPAQDCIEICVYRTGFNAETIAPADVYAFTSPSNVDAFFSHNKWPQNAKAIAWGNSTANALAKQGIEVLVCLQHDQQQELLTWLHHQL
ncbi:MAG: hypothetical protein RLZZ301_18 [Bacteroidota bacterium]|jgi:uroporphyrinogen-III synthase